MVITLMEQAAFHVQIFVHFAHPQLYAYHALILTFWLMASVSVTTLLNNLEVIVQDIVSLAK